MVVVLKQKMKVPFMIICAALFLIGTGVAQETTTGLPSQIAITDLFTWLITNPPNLITGAAYIILGLVGALVAVFGFIGGVIPGTKGMVKIDLEEARLETEEKRLDQLIQDPQANPELIKEVENTINNRRDDLSRDRWKQFSLAAVIYLILGSFFAAMLATNMLQAIVIGFSWTAFIGMLGLKDDHQGRTDKKDDAMLKTEQKNEELVKCLDSLMKLVKELSNQVTTHNPPSGSTRTDMDVARNKSVATMVGDLKDEIGSMNICLTNNALNDEIKMARLL
jgi:hypothetical protein